MPGSRGSLALALALAAGLALRLSPMLATGMPFDCDSWYIHHDVRVLEADPTARIYSDPRLDGYNNRWPAAILEALTLKMVTGARGLLAAHAAGPILDGLAVVPFYALARRLGASPAAAGAASLVVAASPSMALLGGGLVKEAAARPLLYAYPLAALAGARLAYPILAMGLALSHHLTALALAGILALTHPLARALAAAAGRSPGTHDWLATATLAAAAAAYNAVAGHRFASGVLAAIDPYWLAVYIAATSSAVAIGAAMARSRGVPIAAPALAALAAGLVAASALAGLAPGIQGGAPTMLAYAAPALLLIPLVPGTVSPESPSSRPGPAVLPLSWLALLGAATGYLAFAGSPLGQSPVGRLANLALPGLALAAALAGSRRLLPAAAIAALALGPLMLAASLSGADPESFDLPYHQYEAATIAFALECGAEPLHGDSKMRDLAYYLSGGDRVVKQAYPQWGPGYLALYQENLRWGLKLDANLHAGNPQPLAEAINGAEGVSLLYNTGESWLLAAGAPQSTRAQ